MCMQKPEDFSTGVSNPDSPVTEVASGPDLSALLAFDGPAPELVNGRLAMLGFFSALAAELATGEGVLKQASEAPGLVLATFAVFGIASFIPLFKGVKPEDERAGPLTADVERFNGRAACVSFTPHVACVLEDQPSSVAAQR
jgi:Chlorophyll A-B binding protein